VETDKKAQITDRRVAEAKLQTAWKQERFHVFLAEWARSHMPERVKRFSVRT
jgi:hypothetical protein